VYVNNLSGVHTLVGRDDGAWGVGAASTAAINSTLFVSDMAGAETYGVHLGFKQTTAPGITNGALDANASDVGGTITLSAANPVLSFNKTWATTPHCVISSPSGTAFTYSVSTSALTITGGANTNTVTYICIQ
jgi:hypothetical protein